jgi:hypothetical protein
MNIPKSWNDVTLYQYIELSKADGNDMIDVFSILLNTTPDDPLIEDMNYDDVVDELSKLGWLSVEPIGQLNSKVDDLYIKKFNNITLGEFIDIEHYFSEPIDNLHIICSILYRQTIKNKWNTIEWEPYDYNVEERGELFLDQPITKVIGVLSGYIDFRTKFLKSYENLFQESNDDDDFEDLSGREKIDAEVSRLENKAKSKWSWESILLGLSNGDVTKFDELFKTSLILVFNTLSAKKVLGL